MSGNNSNWINILPLIQNVASGDEVTNSNSVNSKQPICGVPGLSLFDTMNAVEVMDIRMDQCVELNGKNLKKSDLYNLNAIQLASIDDNSVFLNHAYNKLKKREVIFNGNVANGIVLHHNLVKRSYCSSNIDSDVNLVPYKTCNDLSIKSCIRIIHWFLINETANYNGESIVETLYYCKYCWKTTWDSYEAALPGGVDSFHRELQGMEYVDCPAHLSMLLNCILIEYSKLLMIGMYAYIKYIIEADTFEEDDFSMHTTLVELQKHHMEDGFNFEQWILSNCTGSDGNMATDIYNKLEFYTAVLGQFRESSRALEADDCVILDAILHACMFRKLQTRLCCVLFQQQSVLSAYQRRFSRTGDKFDKLQYDPTARIIELKVLLEKVDVEVLALMPGKGNVIDELYAPLDQSQVAGANSNHFIINGYIIDPDICYAFHTGLVRTLMCSPMRVVSYMCSSISCKIDILDMLSTALGYVQNSMIVGLTQSGNGLDLCEVLALHMDKMTLEELYEVLMVKASNETTHLVVRSYLYQNVKCILVSPMQMQVQSQDESISTYQYNVSSALCLNSMCNNYSVPLAMVLSSPEVCTWLGLRCSEPDCEKTGYIGVHNSIDKSISKLVHYVCLSRCKLSARLEAQIFPLWGNLYAIQAHDFDQTNPWNQPSSMSMKLPQPTVMNFYSNWVAGINCMFMEAYLQQMLTTSCVQLNELDYMYWYLDYFVNIQVHIVSTMKQYRSVYDALLQRQYFSKKNSKQKKFNMLASKYKINCSPNPDDEPVNYTVDRRIESNASVSKVTLYPSGNDTDTNIDNCHRDPDCVPSYTMEVLKPAPPSHNELFLKARGQIYRSYIRLCVLCNSHKCKDFLKIRSPYTSFECKYWNRFKAFAQCVSTAFLPYSDYMKSILMYTELPPKKILENIITCYTNIKTLQEARKQLYQKTQMDCQHERNGVDISPLNDVMKGIHDKNWVDIMKSVINNQITLNKSLKIDGGCLLTNFKQVKLNYKISPVYPIFELKGLD